jgi:hypothetical protein
LDTTSILREVAISPELIDQDAARVTDAQAARLIQSLWDATGEPLPVRCRPPGRLRGEVAVRGRRGRAFIVLRLKDRDLVRVPTVTADDQ